jgi:hypothetical protein
MCKTNVRKQYLGDVLGSLQHMGKCPCGSQHVSRHARVVLDNGQIFCETCADRCQIPTQSDE